MAKARMTLLGKHTSDNLTTATLGDPLVNPVTQEQPTHPTTELTVDEMMEKLSLREKELLEKDTELAAQRTALETAKILLDKSQDSVKAAKERGHMWYEKYHADHKKVQRGEAMRAQLKEQLNMVESLHATSQKDTTIAVQLLEQSQEENAHLTEQLSDLMADCASEALYWKQKLADSKRLV